MFDRSVSSEEPTVQLQLTGAPQLRTRSGRVHPLERRDAALLALLVVDGPTLRATLAALVWPDTDEQRARNNLRQRLFRLHRLAGCPLVVADGALRVADGVANDLSSLQKRIDDDPDAAGGELLGEHDYADCGGLADWVQAARLRWRAQRSAALAQAAARLEGAGEIARALRYAERLVAEDPLLEHAHRRLMRLHYLRGDRAAALAAFRRCAALLRRELDAEPGAETRELAALVEASRALRPTASVARPTPLAVLRPPRLVGREAQWHQLESAAEGRHAVLVVGESGIGKTRLLTDFAGARPDAALSGARPGDVRVPYALLARLLRTLIDKYGTPIDDWVRVELTRLVPELGPAPRGTLAPLRLRQAVAAAFAQWGAAGLALVTIDDLQFSDDGSLEVLLELASGDHGRTAWLFGARDAELSAAVKRGFAARDEAMQPSIALGPLALPAIKMLLDSLAIDGLDANAWSEPIARHTGGNPMFILETLRALLTQGSLPSRPEMKLPAPASIGPLIERRLALLSPQALKLARVAALAGQDFSAELAAAVLRQHPLDLAEAWRELEGAQVIRGDAFAHDLIFEATLRSVPTAISSAMHRAVAGYLEAHACAPARVAQHWFEAAEWRKAAEQFTAAARASLQASRNPEAGELFRRAADCFERAGDEPERHRALQELAGCLVKAFDLTGAREVAEQLWRIAIDEVQQGWALDRLVDTLNMGRADDRAAEAAARQMLARGQANGQPWMVFNATRKLAVTLAHQGRFDEALPLFETQSDWIAANLHEWNVHVWFCDRAYVLDLADQRGKALDACRWVESLARRHENWLVVYAAQRNAALTRAWGGDIGAAVRSSDEALRLSDRLGDALVERNPRDAARRGALLRDAGRFAEAMSLLRGAHADLLRGGSPYWLTYCADQLAVLYAHLGQPGRARDLLQPSLPPLPPEARVARWIAQSRVARAAGKPLPPWDPALVAAIGDTACPARWRLLALLERACQAAPSEALAWCGHVQIEAQQRELEGIRLHALVRAVGVAVDAGLRETAAELTRHAAMLAHDCDPVGLPPTEMRWQLHRGFEFVGDTRKSMLSLRAALEWIERAALPNVPDEFKDSFLNRNPINRAILTRASRL